AASLGTFSVNINATAPTATLVTQDVLSATVPVTLKVTYATSDGGILVSSLDSNDLIITAPDGVTTTTARFVSADASTNGTPRTATYVIDPPEGGWNVGNNGVYIVSSQAGQVTTTTGG